MTTQALKLSHLNKLGLGTPLMVILLLIMMILPLPPILLDFLFTFNMAFALTVILTCVYVSRPLDFATFPTVLLIATLLRLALNIASTRVVLLHGHTGTDAAGKVVQAFGEVVIGGNYAVGLVVFSILVIINFVVVTKGAGRISEVSARFTLDAMPGKQMAIDADLNSGLINQEEAKRRRSEISEESDFYGSMDGASKFVRGDAIAGILILLINIIGGLIIGIFEHQLSMNEALQVYILLTIGDGLVAQVPSLLLSTATAIVVTRVSKKGGDVGKQVFDQLFDRPKILIIASVIIGILGLIPEMPHMAFLGFSALLGLGAYLVHHKKVDGAIEESEVIEVSDSSKKSSPPQEISWADVKRVDPIQLEIGYRLISMVNENQGGQLMNKIKGVRKSISQDLGFLVPPVHISDDLDLSPTSYRISLMGVVMGESEVMPEWTLAISSGEVFEDIEGVKTKDPTFNLDAVWIKNEVKEKAQSVGYTVVDSDTVIATHLSELIKNNAPQLLGYSEVEQLLNRLQADMPKLIENLVPDVLSISIILQVLQGLLEEQVPLRDFKTIVETLAMMAHKTQDPEALLARVRVALGRLIVQTIYGTEAVLSVMTLEPQLEQILQQSVKAGREESIGIEPGLSELLQDSLLKKSQQQESQGSPAVLLVSGDIRRLLAKFCRYSVPNLRILAFQEIPDQKQIKIVSSIGHCQ